MRNILLVDGYNIIGAWPELKVLKDRDLSAARDRLIEILAEYKAYTGYQVIVVFDAYFVQGLERKYKNYNIDVIYTKENETADERIEKLAIELSNIQTQVHVATSDFTEQWAIFGQGALRKSARELLHESKYVSREVEKKVKIQSKAKPTSKIPLTKEVEEKFEKWRRGQF
ncbi:NYN domain-containing protein [Bacillus massiliigorillae]|uniref:NYN domain-containing protein n=1 Tax=Bacillus massiliigorillae TaxID=1243664 RepID=UPI00039C990B|nr:NYN domain-containing protein [Bacillus massiliigorillae]